MPSLTTLTVIALVVLFLLWNDWGRKIVTFLLIMALVFAFGWHWSKGGDASATPPIPAQSSSSL